MNPTPMCVICGYVIVNTDQLVFNRKILTLQCPMCGSVVYDPRKEGEAALLKLAEHNRVAVKAFEIVEDPLQPEEQYMLVWGELEGEAFRPDRVWGVWGAEEMATLMAYYRETGILRLPKYPAKNGMQYEYIQPSWVYFMKAEAVMYRMSGMDLVDLPKESGDQNVNSN